MRASILVGALCAAAMVLACESDGAGGAGSDTAAGGGGDSADTATDTPAGGGGDTADTATDSGPSGGPGVVVFLSADDERLYRIAAVEGAAPEDLGARLDPLSPGADHWINVSPDGAWYLVGTERFGCEGWSCAVRLPATLDRGEVVRTPDGAPIHPEFSAISNDGALIVYPDRVGDRTDLFALRVTDGAWGAPVRLTGASPHAEHALPALSEDATKVLFTCGETPYAQDSTGICEVSTDGAGFRVVLAPADGPGGTATSSLRSPDYAEDGSIVFEADWDGEQIWRLAGDGPPALVEGDRWNDNSPCALPGGRVASLWLERSGGPGLHEIKVARLDGGGSFLLLVDTDVADIGIGCGR